VVSGTINHGGGSEFEDTKSTSSTTTNGVTSSTGSGFYRSFGGGSYGYSGSGSYGSSNTTSGNAGNHSWTYTSTTNEFVEEGGGNGGSAEHTKTYTWENGGLFLSKETYNSNSKSNGHFLYSGTGSYESTNDYTDPNDGSHSYSYGEWSHVEDGNYRNQSFDDRTVSYSIGASPSSGAGGSSSGGGVTSVTSGSMGWDEHSDGS